jgi:hypothetical protein
MIPFVYVNCQDVSELRRWCVVVGPIARVTARNESGTVDHWDPFLNCVHLK